MVESGIIHTADGRKSTSDLERRNFAPKKRQSTAGNKRRACSAEKMDMVSVRDSMQRETVVVAKEERVY